MRSQTLTNVLLVIIAVGTLGNFFQGQAAQSPAQAAGEAEVKVPDKPGEPATEIERFVARRGDLFTFDFYDLGKIRGLHRGEIIPPEVQVECLVIGVPGTGEAERRFGARFVRPAREASPLFGRLSGMYEPEEIAWLDFDELSALADCLDYMVKLAAQMSAEDVEYREVRYVTRGGLQVGFYQDGKTQTAVADMGEPLGKPVAFKIQALGAMRTTVGAALEKLKTLGAK